MTRRWAWGLAACLILAACGSRDSEPADPSPSPLLYEITSADGAVEGWMFGTIHSLPDGFSWRTAKLDEVVEAADSLIVEIADLEDSAALFETYRSFAMTPNMPDIATRVPAEHRPALFELIDRAGFEPKDFHALETWAVALNLAQVYETGDSDNGADLAMLRAFAGRPITELEGAEIQLGIFDTLPEKEQSDLLVAVISEADMRRDDPGALRRAWIGGDEAELEKATAQGMMADPELREALLVGRNRDWAGKVDKSLKGPQRPLIAVGTGHLVGADSLSVMLEQRGYTVTRIQ